ncbi:hypothetical protein TNCV_5041541 [Trichonephila clavipes]|nr:hypothetical protein TNCV_5041541 [Trichonephila clavipes]
MDVCKCIVHSLHGGTLNSRRAASPLVRLVAGDEMWGPLTLPWGVPFKIGVEPSLIVLSPVWCSRLRPTTGVHLAPCHDEFRGPQSDYVRQVALAASTQQQLVLMKNFSSLSTSIVEKSLFSKKRQKTL